MKFSKTHAPYPMKEQIKTTTRKHPNEISLDNFKD